MNRRRWLLVMLLGMAALAVLTAIFAWGGRRSINAAARAGDVQSVRQWLALGVSPDHRHLLTRDTPLIVAARHGHLEVVRLLLDKGADVNLQGEAWYAPLHCAAAAGHLDVVRLLLQRGAAPTLFQGHDTPLHSAAAAGQVEAVKLLQAQGVDINAKGVDEASPLEKAVSAGQLPMVIYLLEQGAEVNARAIYGRTPLHTAAARDDMVIGRVLLEHGAAPALEYNGRPVCGSSPAFQALLQEHAPMSRIQGDTDGRKKGRETSSDSERPDWRMRGTTSTDSEKHPFDCREVKQGARG